MNKTHNRFYMCDDLIALSIWKAQHFTYRANNGTKALDMKNVLNLPDNSCLQYTTNISLSHMRKQF